jgi:hypothetical protein
MIDEIKELSSKHDIYIPQNFLDALNDIEIERLLYTLRELDKKSYDFNNGFTTVTGAKVPGTSVENQTKVYQGEPSSSFDSRESRLYNRE